MVKRLTYRDLFAQSKDYRQHQAYSRKLGAVEVQRILEKVP